MASDQDKAPPSSSSPRPVPHPALLQLLARKLGLGGRTMAQAARHFCRQAFKGEPQLAEKEISILLAGAHEIAKAAGRIDYMVQLTVRLAGGEITEVTGPLPDQPGADQLPTSAPLPSADVVNIASGEAYGHPKHGRPSGLDIVLASRPKLCKVHTGAPCTLDCPPEECRATGNNTEPSHG